MATALQTHLVEKSQNECLFRQNFVMQNLFLLITVRRLKVLWNRTVFRPTYLSMLSNSRGDEVRVVLTLIIQAAGKLFGMTRVLGTSLKICS